MHSQACENTHMHTRKPIFYLYHQWLKAARNSCHAIPVDLPLTPAHNVQGPHPRCPRVTHPCGHHHHHHLHTILVTTFSRPSCLATSSYASAAPSSLNNYVSPRALRPHLALKGPRQEEVYSKISSTSSSS